MSGYWELNEIEGKNPVHTGQFLNSYDQEGFTPEEVIARESAQNSMDAGKEVKGITELEFHTLEIAGKKKSRLLQMFKFENLLAKRINAFKKNKRNQNFASDVQSFLKGKKTTALLIRDKKTCGLGGTWNRYGPNDHFARLVCALNFDDKADDDSNSGGSFGLRKTAYAENSAINTVLYHSTFKPVSAIERGGGRLQ